MTGQVRKDKGSLQVRKESLAELFVMQSQSHAVSMIQVLQALLQNGSLFVYISQQSFIV